MSSDARNNWVIVLFRALRCPRLQAAGVTLMRQTTSTWTVHKIKSSRGLLVNNTTVFRKYTYHGTRVLLVWVRDWQMMPSYCTKCPKIYGTVIILLIMRNTIIIIILLWLRSLRYAAFNNFVNGTTGLSSLKLYRYTLDKRATCT